MFLPQVQLMELVEALVGVQAHFFRVKVEGWGWRNSYPPPAHTLQIPKSHS